MLNNDLLGRILIWLISDVIERCQDTKTPGIELFLDFKKAIDSIEWSFFFKALETFGFGDMPVIWIKTFYANPQSCITNNVCNNFSLECGVKTGPGETFLESFL